MAFVSISKSSQQLDSTITLHWALINTQHMHMFLLNVKSNAFHTRKNNLLPHLCQTSKGPKQAPNNIVESSGKHRKQWKESSELEYSMLWITTWVTDSQINGSEHDGWIVIEKKKYIDYNPPLANQKKNEGTMFLWNEISFMPDNNGVIVELCILK